METLIQVWVAVPTKPEGLDIIEALVDAKLIACGQLDGPISSIYTWKGEKEREEEWRCVCKTRASLYPLVEKRIVDLHPYETPQIYALPFSQCHPEYQQWVLANTSNS